MDKDHNNLDPTDHASVVISIDINVWKVEGEKQWNNIHKTVCSVKMYEIHPQQ